MQSMSQTGPAGAAAEPLTQRWWVLAASCLVAFAQLAEPKLWMIGFDIPSSAFGTSWGGYRLLANLGVVLFVAFQLVGGALGDMLGRRRIFLISAVGVIVCNLLSLIAWSLPALIIARGLVGIMGALVLPLTLAVIRLSFVGEERTRALVIYTFATALGTLASLLGILIEDWFGWQATLAIPVTAGLVGLVLAWRHLPESRASGGLGRDEAVAVSVWTMVILALIFGLAVARTSGTWRNPITLTAGGAGALGLLVMIAWSQRAAAAGLLQNFADVPRLFLTMLLVVSATLSFALSGFVLQLYMFFYTVQQLPGFIAGLALAPIFLFNLFVLRQASRFTIQQPRYVVVGSGMLAMGVAMGLSALARPNLPYIFLVPVMALFGVGFLVASAAWAYFFFSTLPEDLAGVSSGVNRAAGLVGGALAGLALSTIVQVAGMADFQIRLADIGLSPEQKEEAMVALEGALGYEVVADQAAQSPEVIVTLGLLSAYRESYSVGVSTALVFAAAICLTCGGLAWLWLRGLKPAEAALVPAERPAEQAAVE